MSQRASQTPGAGAPPGNEGAVLLAPGAVVGGHYELDRRLGMGGMGSVWRARHTVLRHDVAIKFLSASAGQSADLRERFEREGRLAARLGRACRHIVQIFDHGVVTVGMGGETLERPYLVMELLEGESLHDRLRGAGPLSLPEVVAVARQLAAALTVLADEGVVHRDLKPANLFLAREAGQNRAWLKLLDFGIAKLASHEFTATGTVLGTPSYMSPEQVRGDRVVDRRSDLWAATAIVYCLLVGKPPFVGETLGEISSRVLYGTFAPVSAVVASDAAGLNQWFTKGLAREPEARFDDAAGWMAALESAVGADARARARMPSLLPEPAREPVGEATTLPSRGMSDDVSTAAAFTDTPSRAAATLQEASGQRRPSAKDLRDGVSRPRKKTSSVMWPAAFVVGVGMLTATYAWMKTTIVRHAPGVQAARALSPVSPSPPAGARVPATAPSLVAPASGAAPSPTVAAEPAPAHHRDASRGDRTVNRTAAPHKRRKTARGSWTDVHEL